MPSYGNAIVQRRRSESSRFDGQANPMLTAIPGVYSKAVGYSSVLVVELDHADNDSVWCI